MSDSFRFILSNSLSFISFLLLVFYNINNKRDSMLRIRQIMVLLTIISYIIIKCYYAAAASAFAILRNNICLEYPGKKQCVPVKIAILLIGSAFSAWCAYPSLVWMDYLPAASFLFCSIGYYVVKSPSTLRIVDALDILLFWIVFDYINLMPLLVVVDLFVVLFPFAEGYVKFDRTDSTEQLIV
jgi:hypothetical protein